jgi:two-component system sensor histidine kinase BaeS
MGMGSGPGIRYVSRMPPPRVIVLGRLGRRLLTAFVVVALSAIAVVVLPAMVTIRSQTTGLQAEERERVEQDIVAALAEAYAAAGSWRDADLAAAQALARSAGLQVVVLNATGTPVTSLLSPTTTTSFPARTTSATSSSGTTSSQSSSSSSSSSGTGRTSSRAGTNSSGHSQGNAIWTSTSGDDSVSTVAAVRMAPAVPADPVRGRPVLVDGVEVGRAVIEPLPTDSDPTTRAARAMLRTLTVAVIVALALSAMAAFWFSRRITRPVIALGEASRALERREPNAVELLVPADGELGDLSRAFTRMAQTLEKEDQLRRIMVADLAHELRTPVTIMRGLSEQVLDGVAPLSMDTVRSFNEEVLRLERLVADLATLSAAQAAGLSLERGPVDLARVVEQAVAQLRHRFVEAGVRIEVTVHGDRPVIEGDEGRLGQIVTNLLSNAVAVVPRGGRTMVEIERHGHQVRLVVADSGPGIAPEDLPKIFDRFYRGASSAGRPGTGIGLAVVSELVTAHGGTVHAESPPGRGAVFLVTLPTGRVPDGSGKSAR